jgi:ubiquinone/menaquinone biosynthesis C-methylase UbiE
MIWPLARFWDDVMLPRFIGCACGSKPIARQRAKIVPQARGVVVDMGFGSGTNLPFYDASQVQKVYAVEPSAAMLAWQRHGRRTDIVIEEIEAGAEATGLPSACADTIVFTFALCTIPDAQAALREARRLLKPQGSLLFCEHGLAPDDRVARFQRRIEPMWKKLAGGCHLTRDTQKLLHDGGFTCDQVDTMYLPGTPRFAGYNVWGRAH